MNYTISDAVRTLALSSLDFLSIPNNKLIIKKEAKKYIVDMLWLIVNMF